MFKLFSNYNNSVVHSAHQNQSPAQLTMRELKCPKINIYLLHALEQSTHSYHIRQHYDNALHLENVLNCETLLNTTSHLYQTVLLKTSKTCPFSSHSTKNNKPQYAQRVHQVITTSMCVLSRFSHARLIIPSKMRMFRNLPVTLFTLTAVNPMRSGS